MSADFGEWKPPAAVAGDQKQPTNGDSISLDAESGEDPGPLPAFESWDEPGGGGTDNRNYSYAGTGEPTPRSSATMLRRASTDSVQSTQLLDRARQYSDSSRNGGSQSNPQSGLPGNGNGGRSVQHHHHHHRHHHHKNHHHGKARGRQGAMHGDGRMTPMGKNGSGHSGLMTDRSGDSNRTGNTALSQQGPAETSLTVKKDQDGRQRLDDSTQRQRTAGEQANKNAAQNFDLGRDFSQVAQDQGAAQQGFQQNAAQNLQAGNSNLAQADQSMQQSKQAQQMGDTQKAMAAFQKLIQEFQKLMEAQGKMVEQTGKTTEMNGQGIERTGQTVETTGHTTEAKGHATEGTGMTMQMSGEALLATGAALAAGVFTAPAGAVALAKGALLKVGGIGLQMVGKGLQFTGKGLQAKGQGLQATGQQTQQVGKQIQTTGKQQQTKAKTEQQKAKEQEQKHLELVKKFLEEMKKFLQQASQQKNAAQKNFQDAGTNKQNAKQAGDRRNQAVDNANNANKAGTQDNQRSDKAFDNVRALLEVVEKLFGKAAGNKDEGKRREDALRDGEGRPRDGRASDRLASGRGGIKPLRGDSEEDKRKKQSGNISSLLKKRRHAKHSHHSKDQKDGRGGSDDRSNPFAVTKTSQGDTGGQNSGDERRPPSQTQALLQRDGESGSGAPRSTEGMAPIQNAGAAATPPGASSPAGQVSHPANFLMTSAQPAGVNSGPMTGPTSPGAGAGAPSAPSAVSSPGHSPDAPAAVGHGNSGGETSERGHAHDAGSRHSHKHHGKKSRAAHGKKKRRGRGTGYDAGFATLGGAGDKSGSGLPGTGEAGQEARQIQPVQRTETSKGSATYDIGEDSATVRLNELKSTDVSGAGMTT